MCTPRSSSACPASAWSIVAVATLIVLALPVSARAQLLLASGRTREARLLLSDLEDRLQEWELAEPRSQQHAREIRSTIERLNLAPGLKMLHAEVAKRLDRAPQGTKS